MDSCTNFAFMHGWCRFHYGTEYLLGKQVEKPPKNYIISHRTKKRASQERKYHSNRKVFIQKEKEIHPQGKIFCIFCDKEIYEEPSLHHANGRDDESILDESFWFLSHNHCHVYQYHSMSCKNIPWWPNYLFRMKLINPKIYKKDLQRQLKAEQNGRI